MRGLIRRRKLKNGSVSYDVVYDLPRPIGQKRKQKCETVSPPCTRKHAEKLLAVRLAEINRGEFLEPSPITLREFSGMWMDKYATGQVRPTTMDLYDGLLRNHLLPALGDMRLADIRTEDVQALKAAEMTRGLSAQTVKHILRLLRQMLSHAVDWEYLRS